MGLHECQIGGAGDAQPSLVYSGIDETTAILPAVVVSKIALASAHGVDL